MVPLRQDPRDPAPRTYRRWTDILAVPANDPGHWYLVEVYGQRSPARSAANNLKQGATRHPEGEWDFAVRKLDDGAHGLYARRLATPTTPRPASRILTVTDHGSFV